MYPMTKFISIIKEDKKILLGYLIVFVAFIVFMPDSGPGKFDRICFVAWANYIQANGLQNIYKFGIDYLPLYQYFLFLYGVFQGNTENIIANINSLKYITLAFDIFSTYLAFRFIRNHYKSNESAFLATLFILLNLAFLYNNIFYGQVDGIYTSMVFVSIYFGLKKKVSLSIIFVVLAINFKLQAIIFLPLIGLLLFPEIWKNLSFKNLMIWLLPAVVLQLLILLPFILSGDLFTLLNVVKSSMGKYPFVTMGAFNFWYWIFEEPNQIFDKQGIFGRSYNRYGLLLFVISLFFAIKPLIKQALLALKNQMFTSISKERILLIATITPLVFFYFNTQMHSRYMHPSILFGGIYALYTRRPYAFILLSIAYFLNIESGMKILKNDIVPYEYFFFQPLFVSCVYFIAIILLYYELYKKPKPFKITN